MVCFKPLLRRIDVSSAPPVRAESYAWGGVMLVYFAQLPTFQPLRIGPNPATEVSDKTVPSPTPE
jgi:hypothetical protein